MVWCCMFIVMIGWLCGFCSLMVEVGDLKLF